VWWRSGQILLHCKVSPDQRSDPGASSLYLPHHHERAAARDLDQQRQLKMTQRQPRLGCCLQVQMQAAAEARFQAVIVQAKWYPQICSFTACGGGVSVVSLVGNVGVCEAASQCGDGRSRWCCRSVLLACQKDRKSVVCARCSGTHGKAGQCRTAVAVRW
jgi:hypothetical protein